MKKHDPLFLHEELLLLALRDDEGTVESGAWYKTAMGGAALAELLMAERIRIDKSTKNGLVTLVSRKKLGDPFLDECLNKVRTAKRRASASTWVQRFANAKDLKDRIADGLCKRGVLRKDEGTVLWLFSRRIYPELDPSFEKEIVARLRRAIFTEARDLELRTVVLVSLANQTGLLKAIFDKKKLKAREKRIERIASGEVAGQATKAAVEAVQAAIFLTTVILPTAISPTVIS